MTLTPQFNKFCRLSVAALTLACLAAAQDQTQQAPHPWRTADQGGQDQAPPPNGSAGEAFPSQQVAPPQDAGAQFGGQPGPQLPTNYGPANYGVPPQLTIKQGTWTTVRLNQGLSSDHNQQGDTFTATLEQPLVVDGFVVAPRGSQVMGRVTEAKKAGRVEGTSRLAVELTGLTLVDGQQVSLQSQMINHNGPTSVGNDVGAVGATTALGAIIGAGAGGGTGAGIGAGAGAAAGIIGVLLTRGHPSVLYPETVLTFQVTAPVSISTTNAPQAYQYVSTQQYTSPQRPQTPYRPDGPPPPSYGYGAGYAYASPYAYPYGAYPYYPYYGGVGVFIGPRYGYYGGYRGYRGYRR
jgi:hypothetical protein